MKPFDLFAKCGPLGSAEKRQKAGPCQLTANILKLTMPTLVDLGEREFVSTTCHRPESAKSGINTGKRLIITADVWAACKFEERAKTWEFQIVK
jgi:hypothetical protein